MVITLEWLMILIPNFPSFHDICHNWYSKKNIVHISWGGGGGGVWVRLD